MAKSLAHFTIARTGEDYLLSFEDEDGETTEFTADFDIVDLISDSIEEVLDADEDSALGVEDEDEEAEVEE
jgi:hypothetical protein